MSLEEKDDSESEDLKGFIKEDYNQEIINYNDIEFKTGIFC
jgi:hypothetical protein